MDTGKWISGIDKSTHDFKKTFGHLTAQQLNFKPNANTWSIAQNIDHLIVINESYYPILKSVREGNYKLPFMANMGFMVRYLGKAILKAVQPDRKKKIKTFPIWQPSISAIGADILDKFEKHHEDFKKLITGSSDLLDKGIIISSPANKNIVYKLAVAFDILVAHEQRHFEQAKELLLSMPK